MALNGVRVGPLDPDATAEFGQVSGTTSARQLVRYHVALNPPALIGALTRDRNEPRTQALDIDEVRDAVESAWDEAPEKTPENFELMGSAVRGHEDAEKVVTFTWRVPVEAGGTGRTGKGFIPYDSESLPESVANGDEAIRIDKLREAGLPWHPTERTLAAVGITGTGIAEQAPENVVDVSEVEAERDKARADAEEQKRIAEESQQRIADLEAQLAAAGEGDGAGDGGGGDPPASPEAPVEPVEPWDGYEGENADAIRKKLGELNDDVKVTIAENVLAFEQRHGKRSSIIAKANSIIDRTPA